MEILKFKDPEILYLLLVIPLLILTFYLALQAASRRLKKFGELKIISQLMPLYSPKRYHLKFYLLVFALVLLIIALAQPQIGSKLKTVKRQGIEIMIALDVSNSMLAQDIKPNRLANAKRAISKLVDKLRNDKIGLIVFAGDAYIQVPITTDYRATKMFLKTLNTEIVPKQGTNIASAIELASKSFSPDNAKTKAIVIITDGEDHEQKAIEMAKTVHEKSINIYTIGMGLAKGAPIPEGNSSKFKTNETGSAIISKLNESLLKQIALEGNGIYVRANNSTSGLDLVFEQINALEKEELETEIFEDYETIFQYFLAFVLVLLILEIYILNRKNNYTKNIQLFGSKTQITDKN